MPVIREIKKLPSELIDQYRKMGGCSQIGAEVWYLEGKLLRVGVIQSVDVGGDVITVITKDKPVKLSPKDKILFTEPHFKVPKDLRK